MTERMRKRPLTATSPVMRCACGKPTPVANRRSYAAMVCQTCGLIVEPRASADDAPAPARHRWVKLRLHVYVCRECGTGKVNEELGGGQWATVYHRPDGTSERRATTPPCEVGPRTCAYLAHHALAIAEHDVCAAEAKRVVAEAKAASV